MTRSRSNLVPAVCESCERGREALMKHLSRKSWSILGLTILVLGGLLVVLLGHRHVESGRQTSEAGVTKNEMRSSWVLSRLRRLFEQQSPSVSDIVTAAEREFGRGQPDAAIGMLTSIPRSDPH